jgi:hypothetical protein
MAAAGHRLLLAWLLLAAARIRSYRGLCWARRQQQRRR